MRIIVHCVLFVVGLKAGKLCAQPSLNVPSLLSQLERDLRYHYVSPPLSKHMLDTVRSRYEAGEYSRYRSLDEVYYAITQDLRRVSKDEHISLEPLHYDWIRDSIFIEELYRKSNEAQRRRTLRKVNQERERYESKLARFLSSYPVRVSEIAILKNNIGVLVLSDVGYKNLPDNAEAQKWFKLETVFDFLKNVDGLILDLRHASGGNLQSAAKFLSYFTRLPNDYIISTERVIRQDSSGNFIEKIVRAEYHSERIRRELSVYGKPIFVMIGSQTFSSGELLAYIIKRDCPKATFIGERTLGGGNAYADVLSNRFYSAIIPDRRIIDKSNANYSYEAIGIAPQISVSADSAFYTACALAETQSKQQRSAATLWARKQRARTKDPNRLDEYTGNYFKIKVRRTNSGLKLTYDRFAEIELNLIQKDSFACQEFKEVRFVRQQGKVSRIELVHLDGYIEVFNKV